jgi:hypothetical protein
VRKPIQFALTDGAGLRVLRWLGRGMSLLAAWPLWYAFFGKLVFDWEAMLFGGPGMLVGLVLWAWAGYRFRHPLVCLEIDREDGVARLRRGEGGPMVCKLDELGTWTIASWKTTSTSGGSRHVTTWHAARCPGFAEQNLFVDLDANACRAWCTKVDAAVQGRSAGPRATTLGELLAERFDAAIEAASGVVATLGLTVATGLIAWASVRQLARTDGEASEAGVVLAIAFALLTFGWRAIRGPALAAGFALLSGFAFVSKPWLAPVSREVMGASYQLSPTAETHLYYVIPGLGLCVIGLALLSTIEIRKPTRAVPRSEPAKLERPEPPQPPGP